MAVFLRRFVEGARRNGQLTAQAFRCNEGSLSYYIRIAPLDTIDGAVAMCDHFSSMPAKNGTFQQFGVFQLDDDTLKDFGLHPELKKDEDDDQYGMLHHESRCFESIFLAPDEAPNSKAHQVMNSKKSALAAIAGANVVVEPKPEKK